MMISYGKLIVVIFRVVIVNKMSMLEIMKKKLLQKKMEQEAAQAQSDKKQSEKNVQVQIKKDVDDNAGKPQEFNVISQPQKPDGQFSSSNEQQSGKSVEQSQKEIKMKQLRNKFLKIVKQSQNKQEESVHQQYSPQPFKKEEMIKPALQQPSIFEQKTNQPVEGNEVQNSKQIIPPGQQLNEQKFEVAINLSQAKDKDEVADQNPFQNISINKSPNNDEVQEIHQSESVGQLVQQSNTFNANTQNIKDNQPQIPSEQVQKSVEVQINIQSQPQKHITPQNIHPMDNQLTIHMNEQLSEQMDIEVSSPLPKQSCQKSQSKQKKILIKQIQKISRLSTQIKALFEINSNAIISKHVSVSDLRKIVEQIKERLGLVSQ